ncbi:MAG: hypothetical protein UHX00_10450 [Caryophanon sp.]|nr:hypothetical protein [Caryophanon sp.]
MNIYDIASTMLIGIVHVYAFQLFLGNSNVSKRFVFTIGMLFSAVVMTLLTTTHFVEFNLLAIFTLLVLLGLIEKQPIIRIMYFALLSIVLMTVVKNGLFQIVHYAYIESPFSYYVSTPSLLLLCTLLFIAIMLFILRHSLAVASRYLIESRLHVPSYIILIMCNVLLTIVNYPTIQLLAKLNALYGEQLYTFVLLIALLFMIVIALTIYRSKKRLIEQHEQSQHEQLMQYVEKLEFLHDELATFRHDYSNVLLSLEQSIAANDLHEVRRIYNDTIAPTARIMTYEQLELTKLARLQQPELKSAISVKVLEAQQKGLSIHLDIPEPIMFQSIPMEDLLRIVKRDTPFAHPLLLCTFLYNST